MLLLQHMLLLLSRVSHVGTAVVLFLGLHGLDLRLEHLLA